MDKSGLYGDVAFDSSGRLVVARMDGATLRVERDDVQLWSKDLSQWNFLMFVSMVIDSDDNVYVSGKANLGVESLIVGKDFITRVPLSFGNYCSQMALVNGQPVCYIMTAGNRFGRFDLQGNLQQEFDTPPTSQGIRFVADDGRVWMGDETLGGSFNGINLSEWSQHGGITVGQSGLGGVGVVGNGIYFIHNKGQLAFFPRLAVRNEKIAVLNSTGQSQQVSYELYTPPYPKEVTEEPPSPPLKEVMIPAFERPMWKAPYFSHHERYGDIPLADHVGNAIAVIGDERDGNVRDTELERIFPLNLPMIVDAGTHKPDDKYFNTTVAWLVHAGNPDELLGKVNTVLEQYGKLPIIAYLDGRGWPDNNIFAGKSRVWPSIQAYRFPNESLDNFVSSMNDVIRVVSEYGHPMCLVSRFDDFNGQSNVHKTLECIPHYQRWLREFNFVAHMPFADLREDAGANAFGMRHYPELVQHARAILYAIPSGRPNRDDYWRNDDKTIKEIWENKRRQTRAAIVLEPYLREHIDSLFEGQPPDTGDDEEPDINEPMLRELVEDVWNKYAGQERGLMVNEIAYVYNDRVNGEHLGLSRKIGGNFVLQPVTNERIAGDIVQVKPPEGKIHSTKYDVFSDAGPILGVAHEHNDDSRIWLPPIHM